MFNIQNVLKQKIKNNNDYDNKVSSNIKHTNRKCIYSIYTICSTLDCIRHTIEKV